MLNEMLKSAVISPCGKFRYRLWRCWDTSQPSHKLVFVMLNPSTADALVDDPTIRRCISFAQQHHFGMLEVVNLFAYRATKPADLARGGYNPGADNDRHLAEAAADAQGICLAWGSHGARPAVEARVQQVLPIIRRHARVPEQCLAITQRGHPAHPLMLPASCRLQDFTLQAVADAMSTAAVNH